MNILQILQSGGKGFFDIPVTKQKDFLNRLGDAKDDIDRSYKQYRCQCFYNRWYIIFIASLVSFVVFPVLLLFFLAKSISNVRKDTVDAIGGELERMTEIIPASLRNTYRIKFDCWNEGTCLHWRDLTFVLTMVVRHPLSPLFLTKSIILLSRYSYLINTYHPKAIIVHNECSYGSSMLTAFCARYNVMHINVMHGEKLYIIRDAYFHYHKCYIWDEHYRNLFISLKAHPDQFVIETPPSMKFDIKAHFNPECYADYKYYLAVTTERKLRNIVEEMVFASKQGKTVKYRLHPRYSDVTLCESILGKENIEYPHEVDILTSISSSGCVIGSYSTVLNQAYYSGVPVIIDDVAESMMYERLKDFKYILINKNISTLSSLTCGCKETSNQ